MPLWGWPPNADFQAGSHRHPAVGPGHGGPFDHINSTPGHFSPQRVSIRSKASSSPSTGSIARKGLTQAGDRSRPVGLPGEWMATSPITTSLPADHRFCHEVQSSRLLCLARLASLAFAEWCASRLDTFINLTMPFAADEPPRTPQGIGPCRLQGLPQTRKGLTRGARRLWLCRERRRACFVGRPDLRRHSVSRPSSAATHPRSVGWVRGSSPNSRGDGVDPLRRTPENGGYLPRWSPPEWTSARGAGSPKNSNLRRWH